MVRALLYLRLTSLRNLIRSRLLRLRQPKYLVGALFAAAYLYLFVLRPAGHGFQDAAGHGLLHGVPADGAELGLGLAALGLLAVVAGLWLLPKDQPGFQFSEAEIGFLFPAPISRRGLLHYKLASALFSSLLQTFFFTAVLSGKSLVSSRAGYALVGWWTVLSFINLHHVAASLTIGWMAERGIRVRLRRWLVGAATLAVVGAGAWILSGTFMTGLSDLDALRATLTHGALAWVLWPLKLLLKPFFAQGAVAFAWALGPALLLLALHYIWVIRMNVSFEEASLLASERRAARIAELKRHGGLTTSAVARKSRRPPFNLDRTRRPEFAFLWKNLLSTNRWFTPRVWAWVALGLVILSLALQRTMGPDYWRAGGALTVVGLFTAGMALLYGPLLSRMDLRRDLAHADLLKAYPLPGWQIVLGELLAPVAVLTGIIWLGLLAWYLGLQGHQPPALSPAWFGAEGRLAMTVCAGVLAPLLLGVELLIPNAAPVLLPAWFHSMRTTGGGLDLMGQRLIFGFGQVLVAALALGVAFAGAAAVHFMVNGTLVLSAWVRGAEFTGPGPVVTLALWTGTAAAVLLGEAALGVRWLGRRFERLDIVETRA